MSQSSSQAGQRWFVAGLLLLFVLLSVKTSMKVMDNRSAFRRWQPQILDIDHVDISRAYNYPNPPIMAVLLEPFAHLSPLAGALSWFYAKVLMTLAALYWTFRLVEDPERPFPVWAKGVTVLLALKPVIDDLNHGNVNLFILFLLVGALFLYRHKRDLLSGVVLGLAIACKVTPALFVPYFLWKRSWKALAGCALGLVLFLYPGVVPSLRLGFADNQKQLLSWYEGMVVPFVIEGKVTSEHANQSLPGVVARLATHAPSFSTWVDNVNVPTRYDHFLSLSSTEARWLVKGCLGLFALVVILVCRTPTDRRDGWRLAAEYGLILVGMLLFSERTWKHHAVTLLVPFAVLTYAVGVLPLRSWLRGGLIGSLVLAGGLLVVTGLEGSHDAKAESLTVAKLAQVYGSYTLAFLLLAGGLAGLLSQDRKTRAEEVLSAEQLRAA